MAPTDPTDLAACLALAQRNAGDTSGWTPEQWAAQMAEDSVQRGDPVRTYFRPYRSCISFLLRPDRVTARTEGDVSEQYDALGGTIEHLRSLDAEWMADRVPPASAEQWSGKIEWGSW